MERDDRTVLNQKTGTTSVTIFTHPVKGNVQLNYLSTQLVFMVSSLMYSISVAWAS